MFVLTATPSAASPFWLLELPFGGAGCLHFDILGNHFGTSGAPWGAIWHLGTTLGDHESSRMDTKWSGVGFFTDFGVILEPFYKSSLNSVRSKLHFCSGLIPEGFFIDFCVEISSSGHPNSRFSHGMYCKNQLFTKLALCKFRTRIPVFFGSLGS